MKYTKIKTFRTSQKQYDTLKKMKDYNVDVGRFIREAIREKLQREKKHFLPKEKRTSLMIGLERLMQEQNYKDELSEILK